MPTGIRSAVANAAQRVLFGGLADLRPMPRAAVAEGRAWALHEYHPARGVEPEGGPVLLVPPLGVPSTCFDLRRGCSLVEHLVGRGRPTYLLDYGPIGFPERVLGLEHWVDEVLPAAIDAVRTRAGGESVHVLGWCLGGILSVLAAARLGSGPIASLTVVASPFDFAAIPLIAPLRPLAGLAGGHAIAPLYKVFGSVPAPLVRRAFQVSALDRHLTKPFAVARNLGDRDYLAQVEAVERFTAAMVAYPGRTAAQIHHHFIRANALAGGHLDLGGDRIDLAAVERPTLVIAGEDDTLAPPRAVARLVELLPDAEVRFATAPGGHLGVLTGRAARRRTWPVVDAFLAEHDPIAGRPGLSG